MSNVVALRPELIAPDASSYQRVSDNKQAGFIVLWRSLFEQGWAQNVYRLAAFVRLLGRASHQARVVRYKSKNWQLGRGQLVVNASELAQELRDTNNRPMTRSQVKRLLDGFKTEGIIEIEGTPFGSVVTICNYDQYQSAGSSVELFNAENSVQNSVTPDQPPVTPAVTPRDQPNPLEDMGSEGNVDQPCVTPCDHPPVTTTEQPLKQSSKSKELCPDSDEPEPDNSKLNFDSDDLKTASWMAKRVIQIHQQEGLPGKVPAPNLKSWSTTIGRMRRIDKLTHHDICALFDWCCKDDFERANVRSPEKLRKRFQELWLKAFSKPQGRDDIDDDDDMSWMDGMTIPTPNGGLQQ
ncbi:hypothetical protein [Celerinatantimonas sp. MCCC 1A17872]|uniref:hypothetical protein n=1 Tax=Celerinatantimonas sp. MCCC 1A17872 TaxID=3177514 RepID=UPI0038C25A65